MMMLMGRVSARALSAGPGLASPFGAGESQMTMYDLSTWRSILCA